MGEGNGILWSAPGASLGVALMVLAHRSVYVDVVVRDPTKQISYAGKGTGDRPWPCGQCNL